MGIPDIQGGGQIIAMLRGPQRLALDLYDQPEGILPALERINAAWLRCFEALFAVIHRYSEGYYDWLGVWSSRPHVTVECDFCALISPRMFARYMRPALAQQTSGSSAPSSIWMVRRLPAPGEHPGAARLAGIQWTGTVVTGMTDWIPLLQRIQAAGKKLVLCCGAGEVTRLLRELKPEGLLLSVGCADSEEADALERAICRMFGTTP